MNPGFELFEQFNGNNLTNRGGKRCVKPYSAKILEALMTLKKYSSRVGVVENPRCLFINTADQHHDQDQRPRAVRICHLCGEFLFLESFNGFPLDHYLAVLKPRFPGM